MKIKILFVCLGNICRSPMAEAIFKEMVHSRGFDSMFEIESKATSSEELGHPVYPQVDFLLKEKGIHNFTHRASLFRKEDYEKYDYLIGMEKGNLYHLKRIVGHDAMHKMRLLIPNYDIEDPYYTRDFVRSYEEIREGCENLLSELLSQKK